MSVKKNYLNLVEHIEKTGKKITIVVAAKYATDEQIIELVEAGATDIGENRTQDLLHHQSIINSQRSTLNSQLTWHFIGHLQTNKINKVVGNIDMLQSLDSLHLAEALHKRLTNVQPTTNNLQPLPALIEVNICRDPHKFGVDPDHLFDFLFSLLAPRSPAEPKAEWGEVGSHLSIQGLMTLGKVWNSEKEARTHFAKMRELFDSLKSLNSPNPPTSQTIPNLNPIHLSMGMSNDYQWAIEEGATMIRVGRMLFAAPSLLASRK